MAASHRSHRRATSRGRPPAAGTPIAGAAVAVELAARRPDRHPVALRLVGAELELADLDRLAELVPALTQGRVVGPAAAGRPP